MQGSRGSSDGTSHLVDGVLIRLLDAAVLVVWVRLYSWRVDCSRVADSRTLELAERCVEARGLNRSRLRGWGSHDSTRFSSSTERCFDFVDERSCTFQPRLTKGHSLSTVGPSETMSHQLRFGGLSIAESTVRSGRLHRHQEVHIAQPCKRLKEGLNSRAIIAGFRGVFTGKRLRAI